MTDNISKRVCSIVAEVFEADPCNIQPSTALSLGDVGWKGFLELALELEKAFDIALPIEVPNTWATVCDAIVAVESAIAAHAAQGRAA